MGGIDDVGLLEATVDDSERLVVVVVEFGEVVVVCVVLMLLQASGAAESISGVTSTLVMLPRVSRVSWYPAMALLTRFLVFLASFSSI